MMAELNWPWVESPFFDKDILTANLTDLQAAQAAKFNRDGYIIIDLHLTNKEIEELREDVDVLNFKNSKTQEQGYHYSPGKRIFEAWKDSERLRRLSLNEKVMDVLRMLYRREPIPFQTITFNYGSNQPFHSDVIHFDSVPHRWLSAAWVALEEMDQDNGPLMYVPGSHKLPIFDFHDLGIKVPKYSEQFQSYQEYEMFIGSLITATGLQPEYLKCKPGQAIIWAANLIHGGGLIHDRERTRYSHVTHYFYEGCDVYYSPMFSEAWKGEYSIKDLTQKDIKGYRK
jgi:hypothetical protein